MRDESNSCDGLVYLGVVFLILTQVGLLVIASDVKAIRKLLAPQPAQEAAE